MRFGTITLEFYENFPQCFKSREVEIVGQLVTGKHKSMYLVRKHDSMTIGGGSPCYDKLGNVFQWISYDGKSLYSHQGEKRYRAYLWAGLEDVVLHPQSNMHAKHVLERLDDL
jgi:hypothetical protein